MRETKIAFFNALKMFGFRKKSSTSITRLIVPPPLIVPPLDFLSFFFSNFFSTFFFSTFFFSKIFFWKKKKSEKKIFEKKFCVKNGFCKYFSWNFFLEKKKIEKKILKKKNWKKNVEKKFEKKITRLIVPPLIFFHFFLEKGGTINLVIEVFIFFLIFLWSKLVVLSNNKDTDVIKDEYKWVLIIKNVNCAHIYSYSTFALSTDVHQLI